MSAILPQHPLDQPGGVKIALGESASDALKGLGRHCLIIATLADATSPEHAQGRMILHCLPCSQDALNGAYRVASGTHRTIKPRATK